ncbi:MAG: Smr/MutS family protein [Brevinematales bacterium]
MESRKVVDEMFLRAMEEIRFIPTKERQEVYEPEPSEKEILVFDFHGMTVKKAQAFLEEVLRRRGREKRSIHLIVGEGHHSLSLRAPLSQMVERVLQEREIPYTYEKGVIKL